MGKCIQLGTVRTAHWPSSILTTRRQVSRSDWPRKKAPPKTERRGFDSGGQPTRPLRYHRTNCGDNDRMHAHTSIWQSDRWPSWQYDLPALVEPLTAVSHAQGELRGRLADVGMALHSEASLATLTEDVVQTSAIEGETLNVASVRSSVARRLGVDIGALAPVDRHVEGVVDMVLDATHRAPVSYTHLTLPTKA